MQYIFKNHIEHQNTVYLQNHVVFFSTVYPKNRTIRASIIFSPKLHYASEYNESLKSYYTSSIVHPHNQ